VPDQAQGVLTPAEAAEQEGLDPPADTPISATVEETPTADTVAADTPIVMSITPKRIVRARRAKNLIKSKKAAA
jgi:hypothetical protein